MPHSAGKRLPRRFGFEFNGMRLHEYYFENLGGNGVLDKSGKLPPMNLRSVSLYTVEVFMATVVRLTSRSFPS